MKRIYERPELNIAVFKSGDVISVSSLQSTGSKYKNNTGINKIEIYF